nr:MAG TPA: hypothetical protein [Caudoviricetes sp.]
MIIQVAQTLEFSEEDGKQFIEILRHATQSVNPSSETYAEPLKNLLNSAKINSITEIKDFVMDCGNAEN